MTGAELLAELREALLEAAARMEVAGKPIERDGAVLRLADGQLTVDLNLKLRRTPR